MKGIREAAMSKEEEPKVYRTSGTHHKQSNYSDPFDIDYDGGLGYSNYTPKYNSSYSKYPKVAKPGQIVVTLRFDPIKIGNFADETNDKYNWDMTEAKATEMAYDEIEKLAGSNYESRYSVSFDITQEYFDVQAVVTLTPNGLLV